MIRFLLLAIAALVAGAAGMAFYLTRWHDDRSKPPPGSGFDWPADTGWWERTQARQSRMVVS